jgi:4a-hydroxytetrahydrobiopterin dehydratase
VPAASATGHRIRSTVPGCASTPATLSNTRSGCLSDSRAPHASSSGTRPALAGAAPQVDNGGMARPKLSDDEVRDGLARLPGWEREGDTIVKVYELESFPAVVDFVGRIAELAEAANHHPDLDIRYRKLRVALSTHDSGGLTAADLSLAGEIEGAA